MRNLLFVSFILIFSLISKGEVLSEPGKWRNYAIETTYINCLKNEEHENNQQCQISKEGIVYRLNCPNLGQNKVVLKHLDSSFYCYSKRLECGAPKPCHILEKVVHQKGLDYCQHGEIKNDRSCTEGETYRFDHKALGDSGKKVVDQCCRDREFFARPGVVN